jgi:1-deoxy-D-xylulose-5-phosphate reductoisomerase
VPVVLNAANEVAVASFLAGRLGFTSIPAVIERTMNAHEAQTVSTVDLIRQVDAWARARAGAFAGELELTG